MPFGLVGYLCLRIRQVDRGGDRPEGRGNFGVDMGHPIVTNWNLLRSSVKVREAIELPFGVVKGVGPGIGALDGIRIPQGERGGDYGVLSRPLV